MTPTPRSTLISCPVAADALHTLPPYVVGIARRLTCLLPSGPKQRGIL
ncbi:MAG: hypothetical protein IPM81_18970 [Saprospirales bacterium]|nr:hypothetical protein [Saprospirales bacterium]